MWRRSRFRRPLRRRFLGRRRVPLARRARAGPMVKRRRNFSRPSVTVIRGPYYASDATMVKLKYTEYIAFDTALGPATFYTFTGNGPFDPNVTGTGTQPLGYDQWSALYDQVLCYGSKITITPISLGSTVSTGTILYNVCPVVDTAEITGLTTVAAVNQLPHGKNAAVYTINQTVPLTNYMTSAKMFGVPKAAIDIDDTYQSVVGANPVGLWKWVISQQAADVLQAAFSVKWMVEIIYYLKFFERTVPAAS